MKTFCFYGMRVYLTLTPEELALRKTAGQTIELVKMILAFPRHTLEHVDEIMAGFGAMRYMREQQGQGYPPLPHYDVSDEAAVLVKMFLQ